MTKHKLTIQTRYYGNFDVESDEAICLGSNQTLANDLFEKALTALAEMCKDKKEISFALKRDEIRLSPEAETTIALIKAQVESYVNVSIWSYGASGTVLGKCYAALGEEKMEEILANLREEGAKKFAKAGLKGDLTIRQFMAQNKIGYFRSDGLIKDNMDAPVVMFELCKWKNFQDRGVVIIKAPRVYGCYHVEGYTFERSTFAEVMDTLRDMRQAKLTSYTNKALYERVHKEAMIKEGM